MTTVYVDPDLGSGGDGSFATPYGAWSSVTFTAGNTYAQRCGSTKTGALTINANGSAGSPVIVTSYDDDNNVPGNGAKPIITTANTTAAMTLSSREYVEVDGFELQASAGSQGPGASVSNANNIVIRNCTIKGDRCGIFGASSTATPISNLTIDSNEITILDGTGDQGCVFLYATNATPADLTNVTITDNHIHDSAGQGINCSVNSSAAAAYKFVNLTISGNTIHGNVKNGMRLASTRDAYTEAGSVSANVNVTNNVVYDCGLAGISLMTFTGGIVAGNEVYECSNGATGTTGGLQVSGVRNAKISRNKCYSNHTSTSYDGVGLFIDVYSYGADNTYESSGNLVVGNECYDNIDWGLDFATWIASSPKGHVPPSSGIRLYRATNNVVTGNYCHENASGITLEQSYGNYIYNNTCSGNTIGLQTVAMPKNAANVIQCNISAGNEYSTYDTNDDPGSPAGNLTLSDVTGRITAEASSGSPFTSRDNYFIWEVSGDGLAVIYTVTDGTHVSGRVIRDFSGTSLLAGAWALSLHTDAVAQYDYNAIGGTIADYKAGDTAPSNDVIVAATTNVSSAPTVGSALSGTAPWKARAYGYDDLPVPLHPDFGCFQDRNAPGRKFGVGSGGL